MVLKPTETRKYRVQYLYRKYRTSTAGVPRDSIRIMGHQKGLRTNARYFKEQSFLCVAEMKSRVK